MIEVGSPYVNPEQVFELLKHSQGKHVHVLFVKRTTGETRELSVSTDLKTYIPENQLPKKHGPWPEGKYDPAAHGLMLVADTEARRFVSLPLETVMRIEVGAGGRGT